MAQDVIGFRQTALEARRRNHVVGTDGQQLAIAFHKPLLYRQVAVVEDELPRVVLLQKRIEEDGNLGAADDEAVVALALDGLGQETGVAPIAPEALQVAVGAAHVGCKAIGRRLVQVALVEIQDVVADAMLVEDVGVHPGVGREINIRGEQYSYSHAAMFLFGFVVRRIRRILSN